MRVTLERAGPGDVTRLMGMERESDARQYILPYSRAEHVGNLADPDLVYLLILESGVMVGFIILALDADGSSVEFRRIVVSVGGRGVGQAAIGCMEDYCRSELDRSRVWLDVFEDNDRARHVYGKLGYRRHGETWHGNRRLVLYDKHL